LQVTKVFSQLLFLLFIWYISHSPSKFVIITWLIRACNELPSWITKYATFPCVGLIPYHAIVSIKEYSAIAISAILIFTNKCYSYSHQFHIHSWWSCLYTEWPHHFHCPENEGDWWNWLTINSFYALRKKHTLLSLLHIPLWGCCISVWNLCQFRSTYVSLEFTGVCKKNWTN